MASGITVESLAGISRLSSKRRGHVILLLEDMPAERVDAFVSKAVETLYSRRVPFLAFFTSDQPETASFESFVDSSYATILTSGNNGTSNSTSLVLYTNSSIMTGLLISGIMLFFVFVGLRCLFGIETQEEFPAELSEDKKQR